MLSDSNSSFSRSLFPYSKRLSAAAVLFIIANALKTTVFNYILITPRMFSGYAYKFTLNCALMGIIFMLLFRLRSRIPFIAVYLLQALYIFANLAYYLYFKSYLNIFRSWHLLGEGLRAAGQFALPRDIRLLVSVIDLPFFLILITFYSRICKQFRTPSKAKKIIAAACLAFLLLVEGWNTANNYSFINFVNDYTGESVIIERYGTLANSAAGVMVNGNEAHLIKSIEYGHKVTFKGSTGKKPNLITIQVESMDANIVNQAYKGSPVMPFLHSLTGKSIYYPYVLSYHKAGGTSDCEFSVFNSVEPLTGFPSIKLMSYEYPNSMVRRLRNAGYSTIAFHGNTGSYFNRNVAYPRIGFQKLHDMNEMGLEHVGWGAPDEKVFQYTSGQLEKVSRPFFSHIITMTSHGPFTNANNYYSNPLYDDMKEDVIRDYFNSMNYVDGAIKEFVSSIKARYPNTFIFIYGDHTPGITGEAFKQASFTYENRYFEFVPLLIITPDGTAFRETAKTASFLDFAPTLLKAAGVSCSLLTDGSSLLTPAAQGLPIPFKGKAYDRKFIFDEINKSK